MKFNNIFYPVICIIVAFTIVSCNDVGNNNNPNKLNINTESETITTEPITESETITTEPITEPTTEEEKPQIANITSCNIIKHSDNIFETQSGDSEQLKLEGRLSNGSIIDLTQSAQWSTDDQTIAEFNSDTKGLLNTKTSGIIEISAYNQDCKDKKIKYIISTPEKCFIFDNNTHTITQYNENDGCKDFITSIVIPTKINNELVTTIGDSAFFNNTSLTTVTMPNVTTIGEQAFFNNTSLTTVTMPNVTTIEALAFAYNTSLTTVTMPNVTTIGEQAFANNTSLTTVTMPSSFNNQTTLSNIFDKEDIEFNFTNSQPIRKLKNKGR